MDQPADQYTYQVMGAYVRVMERGVHIGDIKYFEKGAAWGFVSEEFPVPGILSSIPEIKRLIQRRRVK